MQNLKVHDDLIRSIIMDLMNTLSSAQHQLTQVENKLLYSDSKLSVAAYKKLQTLHERLRVRYAAEHAIKQAGCPVLICELNRILNEIKAINAIIRPDDVPTVRLTHLGLQVTIKSETITLDRQLLRHPFAYYEMILQDVVVQGKVLEDLKLTVAFMDVDKRALVGIIKPW